MGKKKINLMIYGLSVMDGKSNRVFLNNVKDSKSLISCVKEYIDRHISEYITDSARLTLFQFEHIDVDIIKNNSGQEEYKVLYGRVKTGEYGIESELVDIDTKKTTKRSSKQADMMPFGFCIAIPAGDVNAGILILQTMGVYGMKMSLQKHLEKCIDDLNMGFQLMLRTIAPKEYIEQYLKHGRLNKIRMIRYEIPQQEANRLGINYGVQQTKEERIIHKPIGFIERRKKDIQDWLSGQKSYHELIEIDGFEYDDLKFEFALGEGNKTLNLRDLDNMVVSEDITKQVKLVGGHPEFDKLKTIMCSTAKKYLISMGILVE